MTGSEVRRGDVVVSDDGRIGLVLVVADAGWNRPHWELHVDWLVEGAPDGVSICEPSVIRVDNSDSNRALLARHGIALA